MISRCIALIDQPDATNCVGEIIEQFGMRRRLAELAEIAGVRDDPLAEVVLPDAVDHHAGRQRILGPRQPLGQLQPPAAFRDRLLVSPASISGKCAERDRPARTPRRCTRDVVNTGVGTPGQPPSCAPLAYPPAAAPPSSDHPVHGAAVPASSRVGSACNAASSSAFFRSRTGWRRRFA